MVCTVSAYPTGAGRNLNINRSKNINQSAIKNTIKNEIINENQEEVVIPEPEPEIPEIPG